MDRVSPRTAVVPLLLALADLAGCGGAAGGAPPDSTRHRALRAVRAETVPPSGASVAGVPGGGVAIAAAWDRLLASELGVRVTAEHEEPPRSMVLHLQTAEPAILTQQVELMQQVPPGVRLRLVLGGPEVEPALERLVAAGPRPDLLERAERLRVPAGRFSSVWARDFAVGDEQCQVVPLFLRPGLVSVRTGPGRPLNEVVDLLAGGGTRIVRSPVYFAGGNVVVGRLRDGRRLMLCGSNDFLVSRDAYRGAGLRLTVAMFTAVLRSVFDVADAAVLRPAGSGDGLRSQAVLLFHLDQAMLFDREGEVLVHRVQPARAGSGSAPPWQRDVEAAAADLEGYAAALTRLGFAVTRMSIAAERVARCQYYLNSLQVPTDDGPPLLIVPSFAHVAPEADEDDEHARRFFAERGFRVVLVRDIAHLGQGSHHCLVRRG